jgi:threonyl-tRNA synthetase
MLVVGEKEKVSNTISVRRHKKGDLGVKVTEEFINDMLREIDQKQITK